MIFEDIKLGLRISVWHFRSVSEIFVLLKRGT